MPKKNSNSITIFKTPSLEILGMAFLIMLVCKCGGFYPDLSWWIVTAPLWAPWALCIGFFIGFYAFVICILAVVGILAITLDLIDRLYIKIKNAFKKNNKNGHRLHN